jgi:toxin secretion/phage lysis holin
MKAIFILILAAVGSVGSGILKALWGGWSQPMVVLLIMMGLDYFTGVLVALVFRKSPHTKSGGLSSSVGLKGLLRKFILIVIVAAAYQIDKLIGTSYIRDAVAIAFIANEAISLMENAGLMGVPIPQILLKGIEVLKGKADAHVEDVASHSDKPSDETTTITVMDHDDYDEDGSPVTGGDGE